MRILALTRYDRLGASSRVRMCQFEPHLRDLGIGLRIEPFFDDAYLERLYRDGRRGPDAIRYYARRIAALLRHEPVDAVWLEKEALPWLPWAIEAALLPCRVPLIADYDDALFHRYDMHRSGAVRRLFGGKIDAIMRRADLVTAGNAYLATRARQAGARRVEIVPTVVDAGRYGIAERPASDGPVTVGWIGSPATAPYLAAIAPALRGLDGISFVAVGARPDQLSGGPFEARAWREADEVEALQSFDIGIMPLPDTPWERGKCAYKIVQYMACGLPVVASPVGVNSEVVRDGETGFLAASEDAWRDALRRLAGDADLRWRMGAAGRARAEACYSLQRTAPRLATLLKSVAR